MPRCASTCWRLLTGLSCAQAIVATGDHFCAQFRDSGNSYLQERVLDVRDVCFQLLQHIYGEARFPAPGQLTEGHHLPCRRADPQPVS
jgi:fructose-specific PTS system IIA-like component